MTRPANGEAAASTLVGVQSGVYKGLAYTIYLETATAAAYKKAEAAGGLSIAPPLGGDRTMLDQEHLKANPSQYGSSMPASKIAAAGHSTHGYGDCVDILANNAWFQAHCGEYGFVRESPAGENNHYRYLYPTWAIATTPAEKNLTVDEVKRVASYLNARGLGETTTASETGLNIEPGSPSSHYYMEIQQAGRVDGLYPAPGYKINGIPGARTYWLEEHYRDITVPVVPKFTLTFLPYVGATPLASQEIVAGTLADKPADPIEAGFVFNGWSTDGVNLFNFDVPITADANLVGLWTAIPIVVPDPPVVIQPDPPVVTDPVTPVDPPVTIPTEPTTPTTPAKPVKDNWFVAFFKLIASVWFNVEKK